MIRALLIALLAIFACTATASPSAAFQMQGKTQTFTAANTPPTPVQAVGDGNNSPSNFVITNAGSVTAFVSCESTSALATTNASSTLPTRAYPLLPNTQVALTCPSNAFFTGATASSTAVIYVSPGDGL